MMMKTGVGYRAKPLTHLPLTVTLTGGSMSIDHLREENFWEGYRLIQDSASRGDNVGSDEIPDVAVYQRLLKFAHCFRVRMSEQTKICALLLILPEFSSRTNDWLVCEIRIFLTRELWTDEPNVLSHLIQCAERLAVELDLGYVAGVIQVALSCLDWIHAVRAEKYISVAVIPKSINILNKGLTENCKYFKQFSVPIRKKRDAAEVVALCSEIYMDESTFLATSLPQFTMLPGFYEFSNGTRATLRNQRHGDDQMIFEYFKGVPDAFGSDEFPHVSAFREDTLVHCRVCILEEMITNKTIAILLTGKAYHSRTSQPIVGENSTMLAPSYRGKGMSKELIAIGRALAKDEGYQYIINDSLTTNNQVREIIAKTDLVQYVGMLPLASHVPSVGWVDVRFDFMSLRFCPSLAEVGVQLSPSSKL